MIMTAYEKGLKSPAELFPVSTKGGLHAPHINRRFNLSDEEKQRRRGVLAKALTKAGSRAALADAAGIRTQTIRNWELDKHSIPDERLKVLERYLAGEVPHEAH